jgi:ligand-binding sensor domain-containing protein/signal transduction histidine kinase
MCLACFIGMADRLDIFHLPSPEWGRRCCIRSALSILLLCLLVPSYLQSEPLRLSEYQKQEWQVEDGLPENQVRSIVQIPGGPLLLATSGGIATFDGISFKPYKDESNSLLTNEAVNALLVRRNGELWIGTDGQGVLRQQKNQLVNISERAGSHSERIRAMYEDSQGVIWMATQNGIFRVQATDSGEQFEALRGAGAISGDIIEPFAEDGSGGMFFVTSSGIFHWMHGQVMSVRLEHAPSFSPVTLLHDHKGRLWVGTRDGLLLLTPSQNGFKVIVQPELHGQITILLEDQLGNLWVGTRTAGLWRISGGTATHLNTPEGLANEYIRCLFQDAEGNLWIGTLTGGLSRWRIPPLIPFGSQEGLPEVFSANLLADRHGNLWVGTWGKGLYRLHDGIVRPESLPPRSIIRALAETKNGDIWIGTWFDGLFRYQGKRFEHFLLGSESITNAISAVRTDPAGGLWVGTYQGIEYYPTGTPVRGQGKLFLNGKLITCLTVDSDGSMLAGTSNGLFRIRNGDVQPINGLSAQYIHSIAVDEIGNIWVGTKAGGLDSIHGATASRVPTVRGMVDYPVFSVLDDRHGFLWLSTTRGLLRVPRMQLQEAAAGNRKAIDSILLGKADGMRSSQCVGAAQPPATLMKDGSIWFATVKGFVHTSPEAALLPSQPPKPILHSVSFGDTEKPALQRVEIPAGTEDVRISFDALQLGNPYQLEFRYKMERYDHDWTITRQRSAHYRQLPPGFYSFNVQVRTAGGQWSPQQASFFIWQVPYFYETWWLCGLLLLFATMVVVRVISWRVRLAREKLALILGERNRIACDWHDSLMAGFAAISWQLESTSILLRDKDSKASRACDLAHTMVKHCQAEARRIIWDLRADYQSTGFLSVAISQVIAALGTREEVKVELIIEGEEVTLAPDYIHHLLCIVQEAITNAMRHADPSHIIVALSFSSDSVIISVKDDGCGLHSIEKKAPLNGHFGIPVMEERARKLGGALSVLPAQERGTEVNVRVPCRTVEARA